MSMVAHASCLRSTIMRRLGQLEEAADDARVALDFKLATSPPLAVAWAAAFGVDALTALGRLDEADAWPSAAGQRDRRMAGSTPSCSARPAAPSESPSTSRTRR